MTMAQRHSEHPVLPGLVEQVISSAKDASTVEVARQNRPIPKPILPHDLEQALTRLDTTELSRLADAVARELRGRRLPTASLKIPTFEHQSAVKRAKHRSSTTAEDIKLSQSRVNAVRAAIKAGVKPTMVARQFGLSLASVRRVLEDERP